MDSIRPEEVGLSSARLKRIHTHMQYQVDQQKYAGILSVVARHSQVAYSDCVGMMDREARKPMQFDQEELIGLLMTQYAIPLQPLGHEFSVLVYQAIDDG